MFIATCGGAGYVPFAPGTAGTAVGLAPVLLLWRQPLFYWMALAALAATGVYAAARAEETLGVKDSPHIVIDEAVSAMIIFAGIGITWKILVLGFILNRLLDIVKPFPAGRLQDLHCGWGIMLDDIVAAAYGNVLLRIITAI